MRGLSIIIVVPFILLSIASAVIAGGRGAVVGAEISTFARILSYRPESAIDLSGVSGEYCFQVRLEEGGHMTHYAVDPLSTKEDVIDFINADLLEKMGFDLDKFPRHSGKLGTMKSNVWYYLPKGEFEPHHGRRFSFPLLLKTVNVR